MVDEKDAVAGENTGADDSVLDEAARKVREQREEKVPHTLIEEQPQPQSMLKLVVEVARDEWEKRLGEFFKDLRQDASIEGFRKGKVPIKLLQRRYTKEASQELVNKISEPIIREYGEKKKITVYGSRKDPEFQSEGTGPVRITMELEVKPEIDPKDYTGHEVEVPALKVTDEMVNTRIEELRRQNATFEEVQRELKDGDAAVLDMKVVNQKGQTVNQFSNQLVENVHTMLPHPVSHALFGKKAGDTAEVQDTERGQQLRYAVNLKTVKELRMPNIDDDFAKDLGYENAAAMRTSVEDSLKRMAKNVQDDEAYERLLDKIIENNAFEIPPTLRAMAERDLVSNDLGWMRMTGGMPPRLQGKTSEEYEKEVNLAAEKQIKAMVLADAIAKKENIEATEEDVNAALEERAAEEGRKPLAIRAALEKRREMDNFVENVRLRKVRSFLLSKASVKAVEAKKEDAPAEEKPKKRATKKKEPKAEEKAE